MDVDDSDGELELSGISVARSDGFHHQVNHKDPSVYALSRSEHSALWKSDKGGAHVTHDHDHIIKVTRSDGITSDLLSVIRGKAASEFKESDWTSSPKSKGKPAKPVPKGASNSRSLSLASIFGKTRSLPSTPVLDVPPVISELPLQPPAPLARERSQSNMGVVSDSIFHPNDVRIVHLSNSYNLLSRRSSTTFLPKGDILVHSGDFSIHGSDEEFQQFDEWLRSVKHIFHYRIVVLGLRDVRRYGADWEVMKSLLPNASHVLCHEEVTVMGLRFYGCPWHWGHDYSYRIRPNAPMNTSTHFDEIPAKTHILITHGAAYGHLDSAGGGSKDAMRHGSPDLAEAITRKRPSLHLHGHVCGGRGVMTAFGPWPLTLNSCVCIEEQAGVMFATAHVVDACKVASEGEGSEWTFSLGGLES